MSEGEQVAPRSSRRRSLFAVLMILIACSSILSSVSIYLATAGRNAQRQQFQEELTRFEKEFNAMNRRLKEIESKIQKDAVGKAASGG